MFHYALDFNQAIGNWDVSSVTVGETLCSLILLYVDFNQDINNWDISNDHIAYEDIITNLQFNQDINGNWDVSMSPI